MNPTDQLERELGRLFGEDAVLMSQTYVQTLRALHAMAVCASEQNAGRAREGLPTLVHVYASEAIVFADVARELRRATARIKDILDGVTTPPPALQGENPCSSRKSGKNTADETQTHAPKDARTSRTTPNKPPQSSMRPSHHAQAIAPRPAQSRDN